MTVQSMTNAAVQTRIAAFIARAQYSGSTATTLKGAGRYLIALAAARAAQKQRTPRRVQSRASWERSHRAERLVLRYAGATRFPRYLTAEDRMIITTSRAHREIVRVRALPIYARDYFLSREAKGVQNAKARKEIAAAIAARGKLVGNPVVAWDAAAHRWPGAHDRRMTRSIGQTCEPAMVGVHESGSNRDWSKRSTFQRTIDYCLIAPRQHPGVWTMFYLAPDKSERIVYRTQTWIKIQGQAAVRCTAKPAEHNPHNPFPVHLQRRILAPELPAGITVSYDREAKKLTLVDSREEVYHLANRITSRRQARSAVEAAVGAFRQRAVEARLAGRNAALDAVIASQPVWVSAEDSVAAGNCPYGTNSFRSQLERRLNASGEIGAALAAEILAVRDDSYTRRACRAAAIRYEREHLAA